jgi:hypothetical protein
MHVPTAVRCPSAALEFALDVLFDAPVFDPLSRDRPSE